MATPDASGSPRVNSGGDERTTRRKLDEIESSEMSTEEYCTLSLIASMGKEQLARFGVARSYRTLAGLQQCGGRV